MEGDAQCERISGSNLIRERCAQHGAWEVEDVNDRVPAKNGGERSSGRVVDVGENGGRVNAKGIGRNVVDEPNKGYDEEARAVEAQYEEIGGFGVAHGVFLVFRGLRKEEADDAETYGEDDADAKRGPPDG